MKDELGGKIMTEFADLRPKACLMIDSGRMIKKLKEQKNVQQNEHFSLMIIINDCLFKNEIILK